MWLHHQSIFTAGCEILPLWNVHGEIMSDTLLKQLRGWLANRGVLVRRSPFPDDPGIDVLDLLLEREASDGRGLIFLQIGANDGQMGDPMRNLILKYRPRAVLVEPQPQPFARLCALYHENSAVECINAAISDKDGIATMYALETATPCERASLVTSFSRSYVAAHVRWFRDAKPKIKEVTVKAMAFSTLVKRTGIDQVDLLQLDAEGYDFELLKLCLNTSLRPRLINFETIKLKYRDKLQCRQLLAEHGYQFLTRSFDTLAFHNGNGHSCASLCEEHSDARIDFK